MTKTLHLPSKSDVIDIDLEGKCMFSDFIGREKESKKLMDYYYTNENEFIAVYGRIETFKNKTKIKKSVISTFVTTDGVKKTITAV